MIYCVWLLHGQLIVWSGERGWPPSLGAVDAAARLTLASFCPTDNKVPRRKNEPRNEGQSVISCWVPSIVLCNSGKGRSSKHRRFNCGSSRLPTRPDLPSAVVCVNLPARGRAQRCAALCRCHVPATGRTRIALLEQERDRQNGPRQVRLSGRDSKHVGQAASISG